MTLAETTRAACPASSDATYQVRDNDTLHSIVGSAYCLSTTDQMDRAWASLYAHNRDAIGNNPHRIFTGLSLCLPETLLTDAPGESFSRCKPPLASAPVTQAAPAEAAKPTEPCPCTPCAHAAPEVKCPCSDPAALHQIRAEIASIARCACDAPPPIRERYRARLELELSAGAMVPLSTATYEALYRSLAVAKVGVRWNSPRVRLGGQLIGALGLHGTRFNEHEQDQRILGVGAGAQIGYAFLFDALRVTPSFEASFLYLNRRILRSDYPFAGEVVVQSLSYVLLGAAVRFEYAFEALGRITPLIDVSVDYAPLHQREDGFTENLHGQLLGGFSYGF
jgi:hypothetical protein